MFLGHLAVGFAAKRAAHNTSLGLLVAAPLFLDLLWPPFLALGWERVRIEPGATAFTPLAFDHYPWSHSLLMAVAWGLLFGGGYWLARRDRRKGRLPTDCPIRSCARWSGALPSVPATR